jgi:hypothetical protein
MVQGSNPGEGEIFRTHPDRLWGPPSLLYNGYRVSFPGLKQAGRGVNHPPSSSSRVKERVELYLYSSSGPSWPVVGRTLPFFTFIARVEVNTVMLLKIQVFQYVMLCRRTSSRRYFKGLLLLSSASSIQRRVLLGVLDHEDVGRVSL